MAITSLTQQPGAVRYSNGEIGFSVLSDNINNVQFSYVIDIYRGTTRIARRFKQANIVGYGVFDLGGIGKDIDNDLIEDIAALGATQNIAGVNSTKTYTVRFGERYIVNDVLSIFPDLRTSAAFTVIKGSQEQNRYAPTDAIYTVDTFLSSIATGAKRIHRDDTETVSYFDTTAGTIHVPISIPSTGATYTQAVNGSNFSFEIYDERSCTGEDRFIWLNDKGGWDYFTATEEGTESTTVTKETFQNTPLGWGSSTLSNKESGNSSVYRGETTNLRTEIETSNTKNTSWLDTSEQSLVEGIFTSKKVFKQEGMDFVPVVILNGSFDKIGDSRVIPNFQYPIEWRYANDIRTR